MDKFKADLKAQQEAKQAKDINLLNMIESRIMEIVQIEDECRKKLPKLFTQRLPRFMRRRAACHNIKRLPRKLRLGPDVKLKNRKLLLKYRRKIRFQKHKRILKRHSRSAHKDPLKCLMHKWFAKRFKMESTGFLKHVPLHNNTKNQRNLYRQTRNECAFISLAHLTPLEVMFDKELTSGLLKAQLNLLNKLAFEISGFTFSARALENSRYEILVHLYKPTPIPTAHRDYLCSVLAHLNNKSQPMCPEKPSQRSQPSQEQEMDKDTGPSKLTLWVPRESITQVYELLEAIAAVIPTQRFSIKKVLPVTRTRIRLVGPRSWSEATKLCNDSNESNPESFSAEQIRAQEDATLRLGYANDHNSSSFGLAIGRFIAGQDVDFIYYNTDPKIVDLVFKTKQAKMMWYSLVKNKAHLVGGLRDLDRLLPIDKYKLIPDHLVDLDAAVAMNE